MTDVPAAAEAVSRDVIRRLERQARALDPGATRRRRLRAIVGGFIERFLRSLRSAKGFDRAAGSGAGLLELPIAEHGAPLTDVLRVFERDVVRPGAATAAGTHLAYIPGGGLYHSALADYLAAATNKYAGVFLAAPGAVRMENLLVRWAADLVGYPTGAGGHTASGGSIANLTAIATARDARGVTGGEVARSVVYLTDQAHHSIAKGLHLAGLGEAPVRHVALDERYRMRPEALAACIAADRERGLRPWLIVATAGTTDTGAVDPLEAIATIAERERCWLHVDAAYGGFFLLTDHDRRLFRGIERSDSVVLDPHKCLFLPYGSGMVLVREVRHLLDTHAHTGQYMQDTLEGAEEIAPADVSPELTRPFRALRMWLPLVTLGVRPFRAALEEKLLLARHFHARVAELGFEVGPEPELSVAIYRRVPPGATPEEADAINRRLIRAVLDDGRVFLSSTTLNGRVWLRLAAVTHRTHLREIELALRVLGELVQRLPG